MQNSFNFMVNRGPERTRDEILATIAEIRYISADFPPPIQTTYATTCDNLSTMAASSNFDICSLLVAHQTSKSLLKQAKRNAKWPREPLQIPSNVISRKTLYYYHKKYGLILLHFHNPLPMSNAELFCDGCESTLMIGYQCVDNAGERDMTSFDVGFSGFDLCLFCATKYFNCHWNRFLTWIADEKSVSFRFKHKISSMDQNPNGRDLGHPASCLETRNLQDGSLQEEIKLESSTPTPSPSREENSYFPHGEINHRLSIRRAHWGTTWIKDFFEIEMKPVGKNILLIPDFFFSWLLDQRRGSPESRTKHSRSSDIYEPVLTLGHEETLNADQRASKQLSSSAPRSDPEASKDMLSEVESQVDWIAVSTLSCVTYEQVPEFQEECCLCTDLLSDSMGGKLEMVCTPCDHYFHEGCVQKVRRSELAVTEQMSDEFRCPLCRTMVNIKDVHGKQSQLVSITWCEEKVGKLRHTDFNAFFLKNDKLNTLDNSCVPSASGDADKHQLNLLTDKKFTEPTLNTPEKELPIPQNYYCLLVNDMEAPETSLTLVRRIPRNRLLERSEGFNTQV